MDEERPIEKLLRRYAKKRRDDAGAPQEMHPATRRMLQGEVSRRYPQRAGAGASSGGLLEMLRQRWVYAVAALSVMVIAGIILVSEQSNKKQPLASTDVPEFRQAQKAEGKFVTTDREQPTKELFAKAEQLPTATKSSSSHVEDETKLRFEANRAPKDDVARRDLADNKNVPTDAIAGVAGETRFGREAPAVLGKKFEADSYGVRRSAVEQPAPTPSTPAPAKIQSEDRIAHEESLAVDVSGKSASATQPEIANFGTRAARKRQLSPAESTAAPAATPAPASVAAAAPTVPAQAEAQTRYYALADFDQGQSRTQELSAWFANNESPQPIAKDKAKAVPVVLAKFKIEQKGTTLRVIDADGSTYVGEVESLYQRENEAAIKGAVTFKELQKTPPGASATTPQNYNYRVSGTNRTLNQQVVFAWNFVSPTNVMTITNSTLTVLSGDAAGAFVNSNKQAEMLPSLLNNSGVSGRVQVDQRKELPVNAIPSKP